MGIRADPNTSFAEERIWWNPVPDESASLELRWEGGVCGDTSLRITEEGQAVTLAVSEGPLPDTCPAIGIAYGVILTFNVQISDLDISVRWSV